MVSQILIVEDDVEGADAIRQYLEFRGFAVEVVSSGEAAMEAVESGRRYDVVITDLHLPGIRGDELAERLHSRPAPPPKVIALSGEHAGCLRAPFDIRLPKPCKPKTLIEAIGQLLRSHPPAGHSG